MSNYEIKSVSLDEKHFICVERCGKIEFSIRVHGQHDGRPWSKEFKNEQEELLAAQILEELKPIITGMVKEVNPFSIHA